MGFFSSIFKGVKKAFSKVVEVGKKIIKSPIGKIALVAAGAYFLAPAIIGAAGAGGAAAAGTAATAGSGAAAGAASGGILSTIGGAIGGVATAVATGTKALFGALIGTSATTSVAGNVAGEVTKEVAKDAITHTAGTGLLGFASAHPLLAATGLQVGGQMVAGYAQGKQMEKAQEREERMIADAQQREERLAKEARDRQTYSGIRGDGTGDPIRLGPLLDDLNYKLKNSNKIRTV